MKKSFLIFTLIVFSFLLLSSCGKGSEPANETVQKAEKTAVKESSSGLKGTYLCTKHWNKDFIGKLKIVFREGNKVSFPGMANATYQVKGDSVYIDLGKAKMNFKIDGNTIIATGSLGPVAYTKQ